MLKQPVTISRLRFPIGEFNESLAVLIKRNQTLGWLKSNRKYQGNLNQWLGRIIFAELEVIS